jgi:hypothetical protein
MSSIVFGRKPPFDFRLPSTADRIGNLQFNREKEDHLTKKIGIMVGRENAPGRSAFIAEVNRRNVGVTAEFVNSKHRHGKERYPYDLIVDRISLRCPTTTPFSALLCSGGTVIVNNPFWWAAIDDKLFSATIYQHSVAHPAHGNPRCRAYLYPRRGSITAEVAAQPARFDPLGAACRTCRRLPGHPQAQTPAAASSRSSGFENLNQLWDAYNQTGAECMILQEFIG